MFTIDNYGKTVKCVHQPSKWVVTWLYGTNKMVIKVNQYMETKYDHLTCEVKYVTNRGYPLSINKLL